MFNLNTFNDVYKVAQLVGYEGLQNLLKSAHADREDKQLVRSFIDYAESDVIQLSSFNDGNNSFEVDLHLGSSNNGLLALLEGEVIRHGFGSGRYPVIEYFKNNGEELQKLVDQVEEKAKFKKSLVRNY
jgi:hypothetical protein